MIIGFITGLAAAWPAGTGHHLTDADRGECSAYRKLRLKLHLYIKWEAAAAVSQDWFLTEYQVLGKRTFDSN